MSGCYIQENELLKKKEKKWIEERQLQLLSIEKKLSHVAKKVFLGIDQKSPTNFELDTKELVFNKVFKKDFKNLLSIKYVDFLKEGYFTESDSDLGLVLLIYKPLSKTKKSIQLRLLIKNKWLIHDGIRSLMISEQAASKNNYNLQYFTIGHESLKRSNLHNFLVSNMAAILAVLLACAAFIGLTNIIYKKYYKNFIFQGLVKTTTFQVVTNLLACVSMLNQQL